MTDEDKPGRYQMFKGTSNDITPKSRLWRYMTFERFCWLVETSKLYHPRLDQFNDPFEGAVTYLYARLRDSGALRSFNRKEWEPWMLKLARYTSYATCWHASEHESDAQWQLYGSGGAGIAILSTMERVRKAVDFLPHLSGILGQVEYVDFQTSDMRRRPTGTFIRPGHLKRKGFEHEREVRGIIYMDIPSSLTVGGRIHMDDPSLQRARAEMPLGIAAKVNLKDLIEAIVISPVAAPFVEELVHILTQRHGLHHLVQKSDLSGSPAY